MAFSQSLQDSSFRDLVVFNSFSIKVVALAVMTIDHVAVYLFEFPAVAASYVALRSIGRIAAPLFLFVVTESARHTSSRPRFILRLYSANLLCEGIGFVSNNVLSGSIGTYHFGNIFPTLMYTVVVIHFTEKMVRSFRGRKYRGLFAWLAGLLAVCLVPALASSFLLNSQMIPAALPALTAVQASSVLDMAAALLPSILTVEYSLLFVLLGLFWYWSPSKALKVVLLVAFSLLARFPMGLEDIGLFFTFFGAQQYYMVLAAPLIALYNGKRGPSLKYLFYAYYIIHPYILIVIGSVIGANPG